MKQFGLNDEQVQISKEKYGTNQLSPHEKESFWDKYKGNFEDPIIRILLVALAINIVFAIMGQGEWFETIGILIAVVLATFVSTYSEYSNENTFQQLQEEASRITCKVLRNGKLQELLIDDLVVGDAIVLQGGDKIPVDGILVDGDIKVDQSVLNGESKEATKVIAPENFDWDANKVDFLDQNKIFRGAVVVGGEGIMQTVKVGDKTIYGELTQELKAEDRDSPLKVKLTVLAQKISVFGYVGGIVIAFAVLLQQALLAPSFFAYFHNYPVLFNDIMQAIILAVIIIVMAVPEGLPLMIAIVSSLNMSKMLKDNVLVRKIVGIETAGSLNILFSDKTGTITRGKLEVVRFLTADNSEYENIEQLPDALHNLVLTGICQNTSAQIVGDKVIGGNSTERALSQYVMGQCSTTKIERVRMVPFNSTNKYSFAVIRGDLNATLIKGAPEKLILLADYYYDAQGVRQAFTQEMKDAFDKKMLGYAEKAIRMLALCVYDEEVTGDELPTSGITMLGVLGIRDEVRPEAVAAIAEVQRAGVQVVMITGDRRETALAIAKDSGLIKSDDEIVLTSDEMATMTDDELKKLLPKLRVVARALPSDKSRFVNIAQELNLVVGMTGDGVNDSPALKKADVGFAMGSGTEVAKEAGDIVILDDNFRSIEKAILYGRTIYNSIRKFITFQLTINVSAVAISFIAPLIGIDRPLTITQILWINLVMDTLAAIAFGGEPPLAKYMDEIPKRRDENILSKNMISSIFVNGTYMTIVAIAFFKLDFLHGMVRSDVSGIYLYTTFFTLYTMMAVVNGFNVRVTSFNLFEGMSHNPNFLKVMGLIVVVQILMTFIGGKILRTTPLNMSEWMLIAIVALSLIVVDFIRKALSK